ELAGDVRDVDVLPAAVDAADQGQGRRMVADHCNPVHGWIPFPGWSFIGEALRRAARGLGFEHAAQAHRHGAAQRLVEARLEPARRDDDAVERDAAPERRVAPAEELWPGGLQQVAVESVAPAQSGFGAGEARI